MDKTSFKEIKLLDNSLIARSPILVVGPGPGQVGGVTTFIRILTTSPVVAEKYELIHLDTSRDEPDFASAGRFDLRNLSYFLKQAFQLIKIAARHHPRIMHLAVTSGLSFWKISAFLLIGKLFGIRIVAHLHGGGMRKYFLMQAAPVQHIIGWVLKCADVVIALSRQWQLFLLNEVRSDLNVVVIENTIDSDFAAENEKDDYPKRQDGNTVLFVGQLARAKGVFDILSAAQVVLENRPGTRFLIAGGSQEAGILDELQQRTDEAGLSGAVHLLGLVTGTAKVNLFRQATVFILPSYGEGMPYVLLEAMSVGLPIITTPVGSIPEIIRNEINGFLVEPGDVQAIALRLIQLLKDPLLRNQFGQVNRMLIRDSYLPDSAMNRLVGIYDQLM